MPKIKNITGSDLIVPGLGGRLVLAGQVVEVPTEAVYGYTCQTVSWQPADKAATDATADGAAAELERVYTEFPDLRPVEVPTEPTPAPDPTEG